MIPYLEAVNTDEIPFLAQLPLFIPAQEVSNFHRNEARIGGWGVCQDCDTPHSRSVIIEVSAVVAIHAILTTLLALTTLSIYLGSE